jgi:putative aldouronate transport system permease protein
MTNVSLRKKAGSHIKDSPGVIAFTIFNYAFIIFFCFTIFFPLWDLVVISFSDPKDISVLRTNMWPKTWVFDAYSYCFKNPILGRAFINSVARTVLGSVYHLTVCCLAAFALTRNEMPGIKLVTIIFLITMYFSGGMIPSYLNIRNLGLIDTFWVYIIPGGFSMYNTIVIRNYFNSIDKAMEESATIDGCTMFQFMYKILLPLSLPVLATVGLWQIVAHWNSWFDNMIYVKPENLITLQYLLRRMADSATALQDQAAQMSITDMMATGIPTPQTIIAATTVIIMVPVIIVYPFLQRYFVQGIMVGAVKG